MHSVNKILFFMRSPVRVKRAADYKQLIVEINDRLPLTICALTESETDKSILQNTSGFQFVWAANEGIEKTKPIAERNINELSKKYHKYHLQKVRLETSFTGQNLFHGEAVDVSKSIFRYLAYFEELFERENFSFVCLGFGEAYNNALVPLLDAVCIEHSVHRIYQSGTFQRIMINENSIRASKELELTYKGKITSGLSESEKHRLSLAKNSYMTFKRTTDWKNHITRNRSFDFRLNLLSVRSLLVRLYEWKAKPIVPRISKLEINYSKDSAKAQNRYVLLLENKNQNYRGTLCSPFYSQPEALIRNISISLPLTHSLLVRNHPGTRNLGVEYLRTIKKLGNVILVEEDIDFFDLINISDIVFTVASSTCIDALLMQKHVITFGNCPFLFGDLDAPVQRVNDWEMLPDTIAKCLEEEPNLNNIEAYLYSFLKHTYPVKALSSSKDWFDSDFDGVDEGVWYDFKSDHNLIASQILVTYLSKLVGSMETSPISTEKL